MANVKRVELSGSQFKSAEIAWVGGYLVCGLQRWSRGAYRLAFCSPQDVTRWSREEAVRIASGREEVFANSLQEAVFRAALDNHKYLPQRLAKQVWASVFGIPGNPPKKKKAQAVSATAAPAAAPIGVVLQQA